MLHARFVADNAWECGCDEAGRGCLAGPVVAAAVILPQNFSHPLLNDSKQVSESHRQTLRSVIEQKAIAFCVAEVSASKIDEINILQASVRAMHLAIKGLDIRPARLLVDGNYFRPYYHGSPPYNEPLLIPHHCLVGGDGRYMAIAAASILAKTYRDERMIQLAAHYPGYGWEQNKGYPTKAHRAAIDLFGASPHHRQSFRLYSLP